MPDLRHKRCPICGKRPIDPRLVQCPDCRVAFEYDHEPASGLTAGQLSLAVQQILGSWKLWAGLLVIAGGLIASAAIGIHLLTERSLDQRTKAYLDDLNRKSTNLFADAYERVSQQISNQIAAEFKQPRIKAAIEQVAADQAGGIISNNVWASLQAFRESLNQANAQLAQATNDLANLSTNLRTAQQTASQMAAGSTDEPALLRLVDQTVTTNGSNFVLTLFFRPTSNKPVGAVDVIAGTYRQTAKVVNMAVRNAQVAEPFELNDVSDAGRLQFNVSRWDVPVIMEIEVSAPTIVKVLGDKMDEELTLPVRIDRMQIPATGR